MSLRCIRCVCVWLGRSGDGTAKYCIGILCWLWRRNVIACGVAGRLLREGPSSVVFRATDAAAAYLNVSVASATPFTNVCICVCVCALCTLLAVRLYIQIDRLCKWKRLISLGIGSFYWTGYRSALIAAKCGGVAKRLHWPPQLGCIALQCFSNSLTRTTRASTRAQFTLAFTVYCAFERWKLTLLLLLCGFKWALYTRYSFLCCLLPQKASKFKAVYLVWLEQQIPESSPSLSLSLLTCL